MIAGLSLHLALAVFGRATWPRARVARVFIPSLAFGVGYTIYSEWLNIHVRGRWAYSDLMPVVPVIGTGLAPLLQWFVVPTLALWVAIGREACEVVHVRQLAPANIVRLGVADDREDEPIEHQLVVFAPSGCDCIPRSVFASWPPTRETSERL